MRVMLFSDTYPPQVNGVATSVYNLAQALASGGHSVVVCTVFARGSLRSRPDDPFPVIRTRAVPLPMYSEFSVAPPIGLSLARIVRHFRPDVIHCHTPFSIGWQGARASDVYGIPLIGTHHTLFGEYVESYSRLGNQVNTRIAALIRRYVARFYNRCDVTSTASRFLADDLVAGGLRRPVHIVHNPVKTDLFRPLAADERPARASGETKIVYFGRLAAEKNLPQLLALIEPALRRHPQASLDIVGDGPMMGPLVTKVRQRGLEGQVSFKGWMRGEALARHVAGADICVSASLTENQPLALLESLACGVPVVALAAAGVPEIIDEGRTGYLVDPADTSGLFARRVETLIADAALRGHMSAQAHAAAQQYSPEACLQATLASYEEAIALGRPQQVRQRTFSGLRARRLASRLAIRR